MRADLDELYRIHHAELRRFAARHLGDAGADDIVAATFELAMRKLPEGHPHPLGWLFRSATNLIKNYLRSSRRELSALRDAAVLGQAGEASQFNDVDAIPALLNRLPPRHSEVLRLAYWDRLPAADVGVVLGCSERAVWKRVSRAKAALKSLWAALDASETWEEFNADVSTSTC